MFVLSFDLQGRLARRHPEKDPVPELLASLAGIGLPRPGERTAGDEAIAVADRAEQAVEAAWTAVEIGGWSVGIGVGPASPLESGVRDVRGPSLQASREALKNARRTAGVPLCVRAADPRHAETAQDAEAVLRLVGRLVGERGSGQRRAVRAARTSPDATQAELAATLGVRQQTVSRALRTAGWHEEIAARPLAIRLLAMIDLTSSRTPRRGT